MGGQFTHEGPCKIDYYNTGSAIAVGDDVVLNDRLGFAEVAIAATTGIGAVRYRGQARKTRNASDTFTQRAPVFWDRSASEFVNVRADTDDVFAGWSMSYIGSAAAGDLDVELAPFSEQPPVVITSSASTTVEAHHFGNGYLSVRSTQSTSNALAIPAAASVPGARIRVVRTVTGACTITPASGTIAGGASHNSLDAANDWAIFEAVGTDWVVNDSAIA